MTTFSDSEKSQTVNPAMRDEKASPLSQDTIRLLGKLGSSDADVRAHATQLLTAQGVVVAEPLRLALRAGNELVRKGASDVLATVAPEALLAVLDDTDSNVRNAAAEALARQGARLVPLLLDALAAPTDAEHCNGLLQLLGRIGDERAVVPIEAKLNDRHAGVRLAAAQALARLGPSAFSTLRLLLAIGGSPLRRAALSALLPARDTSPDLLPALLLAVSDPDDEVRRGAVECLSRFGTEGLEPLLRAIQDKAAPVRVASVRALGTLKDSRATMALVSALLDADTEIQRAARTTLGELRDVHEIEPLVAALSAPDQQLSQIAFGALRAVGPSAVPALIAAMETRPSAPAARLLGLFNDARAVPVLIHALNHAAMPIRTAAVESLGQLRDARAVPALISAAESRVVPLSSQQPEKRAEANAFFVAVYAALGKIGDDCAVPVLIATLDETNEVVQQAAVNALESMGNQVLAPLINALDAPHWRTRISAVRLLCKLRDGRALPALLRRLNDYEYAVRKETQEQLSAFCYIEFVGILLDAVDTSPAEISSIVVYLLDSIGSSYNLPRMVLAHADFSPQEKHDLLLRMKSHLPNNIRNSLSFCERIIEANALGEKAARAGAQEVLNYAMLVRGGQKQHSANGQELLRGAAGNPHEAAPDTLPRPSDAPSAPDEPHRSGPLDRWLRRLVE